MEIVRKRTRQVRAGGVTIGGDAPVVVQSMTSTDTRDVPATLAQIRRLTAAGCELVRLAIPDMEAAAALKKIKQSASIPLAADIHFDHELALASLKAGADKLRINPGNIGAKWKVEEVIRAAADAGVPVRIGVNAGSLPRDILKDEGGITAKGMVRAATRQIEQLGDLDFHDIVLSLKAFDIPLTIDAYRAMSETCDYPLHIGITEAGTPLRGSIRSAVGLGILLAEGIGDTLRVSLTADPVEEVKAGYEILKCLGLREHGPTLVSCPTCGRSEIDLQRLALRIEERLENSKIPIKVAVMGCVVNGPGEAKDADVGVAGGEKFGVIFRKGKAIGRFEEHELESVLMKQIRKWAEDKGYEFDIGD